MCNGGRNTGAKRCTIRNDDWQVDVIAACLFLSEHSEKAKREFLARQRYMPRIEDGGTYVVTLGNFDANFARIVVSADLTDIDFADMYGSPWMCCRRLVSTPRGSPASTALDAEEVQSREPLIEQDLLFDYEEDEIRFHFEVDESFEALKLRIQDREEWER